MTALVSLVGGARPNFMKLAPLYDALRRSECFAVRLVHTGQHYDEPMSGTFFRELGLPDPHATLAVGSGTHAAQTARVLERFEADLRASRPDLLVVVGDVNSTLACALAAAKTCYDDGRRPRIAHVEAGLRSFDRTMPEEINRVLTDAIADYLFVTEPAGVDNLLHEGCTADRVFLVGNLMIDTLLACADDASAARPWLALGLQPQGYAVATLHRPANVDDPGRLAQVWGALCAASARLPVVFPVHPRTRARLADAGLEAPRTLILCGPQPYGTFLGLMAGSRVVLTDSGGIQEETTMLGVPCLTLRENTERPITLLQGTNRVVGTDPARVVPALDAVLAAAMPARPAIPLWDGHAATRIVQILEHDVAAGRIGASVVPAAS